MRDLVMALRMRLRGAKGQALVEFALLAPWFLLLLFAIIQSGLVLAAHTGVTNAVRNTARYASTWPAYDGTSATAACPQVKTQLVSELGRAVPGFQASRLTSTVTYSWIAGPDGNFILRVTVAASYAHPLFLPLAGNVLDLGDGVTDGALAIGVAETMRVENPPLASSGSAVTC